LPFTRKAGFKTVDESAHGRAVSTDGALPAETKETKKTKRQHAGVEEPCAIRGVSINAVLRTIESEAKNDAARASAEGMHQRPTPSRSVPQWQASRASGMPSNPPL
jgi:hypothetical protein